MNYTPTNSLEQAVTRAPFLRFVQEFVLVGGMNAGHFGLQENMLAALDRAGLIRVGYKKPINYRAATVRRFRVIVRGDRSAEYVTALHRELRQRNVSIIMGFDDGWGRAAFRADWAERRQVIKQAAVAALRSLNPALTPATHCPTAPPRYW